MMKFLDYVKASLKDHPPVIRWFYVSWRTKEGQFLDAVVVQGEDRFDAAKVASKLSGVDYSARQLGELVEIPADKVPSEAYRNRKLAREDVERIWN